MLHGLVLTITLLSTGQQMKLGPILGGEVGCEAVIRETLNHAEGGYVDTHRKGDIRLECSEQ